MRRIPATTLAVNAPAFDYQRYCIQPATDPAKPPDQPERFLFLRMGNTGSGAPGEVEGELAQGCAVFRTVVLAAPGAILAEGDMDRRRPASTLAGAHRPGKSRGDDLDRREMKTAGHAGRPRPAGLVRKAPVRQAVGRG